MGFLTEKGRSAFAALNLDRARSHPLAERMRWTLRRACEELSFHVPEGYSAESLAQRSPRRISILAEMESGLAVAYEKLATEEMDEAGFRRVLRRWYDLQRQCFGAYEVLLPQAA